MLVIAFSGGYYHRSLVSAVHYKQGSVHSALICAFKAKLKCANTRKRRESMLSCIMHTVLLTHPLTQQHCTLLVLPGAMPRMKSAWNTLVISL